MLVNVETTFHCPYEIVVEHVNMSKTLDYIAFPLMVFHPVHPEEYPKIWKNGHYQVRMKLLNFVPFGRQFIGIEKIKEHDENEFILRDNGTGDVIKRWDHWILIKRSHRNNVTHYIDRIDIKAGVLTVFVWLYANVFYRWRQHRWKKLVKNQFKQLENYDA